MLHKMVFKAPSMWGALFVVWSVFLLGLFFRKIYFFYVATRLFAEMACAGVKKRNIFTLRRLGFLTVKFKTCFYEGWNFNSGNYLFTTDTK